MSRIFESVKRDASEYYLFCILSYALIAPIWYKYATWFSYEHVNEALLMPRLICFVLLVAFGAILKHRQPKLKIVAWFLISLGGLLQVVLMIRLYATALTNYVVGAVVLLSIAVSIWSILVGLNSLDFERNKRLGRKILKYFILTAAIFFVAVSLIGRYYGGKINEIVSSGSLYVPGGLNAEQMARMMDVKIWQANLLLSILTIAAVSWFFIFYKRVKQSL